MTEALTLADLLKGKPLEPIQVAYVAVGLLRALERLHAQGQTRGRLTPPEVLLTDPVSLATPPAAPDPTYETPETLLGQAVTPQTDLYAFGLLLYELLTRRPPFVASDGETLRKRHLEAPIPDPRTYRPDLDLDLVILLLSLLDKDPAFRPASAAEVRRRLMVIWRLGAVPMPPKPDDLIGQLVSRCQVESLIGEGRLAWVFLARDVFDKQPVAVKVFKPAVMQDPTPLLRFRRDAAVLFELNDPHIAQPLGTGEIGRLWYLLVRYRPGRPLRAIMDEAAHEETSFSRREVLDFVGQAAQALTLAHGRGVAHGDVTPHNILVTDKGQVVLTDFGLAAVEPVESTLPALTGVTQVQGTPAYLAPEQIRAGVVTPATDVYALGVVAYELLTGRPPFVGETDAEVLAQHLEDTPPTVRSRRPELLPDVDMVFRHTLAKDPADRFKSPVAFAQALENAWYIPPPPPPPEPPPPPKPALAARLRENPALRRRIGIGALTTALILVVVGLLAWTGVLLWNTGVVFGPAAAPPSPGTRPPTLSVTPPVSGTLVAPTLELTPEATAARSPVARTYRATLVGIKPIAGCFIRGRVFNAAGQGEAGVEVELYNANKQWMNTVITVAGGGYEFVAGGGGGFYLKLRNRRSEWSPLVNLKFGEEGTVDWHAR